MNEVKQRICAQLEQMKEANRAAIAGLCGAVSLQDYAGLVFEKAGRKIWTKALQTAVREHEVVYIPAGEEPYWLDDTVVIPSNRHIEAADGAVIRLTEDTNVLMLRNERTCDGTHAPVSGEKDRNISIAGGRWEESRTGRAGYGKTGMYDADRSFFGVSTCMFFNNIENLTLTNMTFAHAAGFGVQLGDAHNVVCEDIHFDACYADGLHINGNCENVLVRRISGEVGDDLVALNMYDWQNSSVDFGPTRCVLCEDLTLAPSSRYKALRIEPGTYTYDDGSTVDCSLTDAIIRRVKGIHTFKLYFQTPRYVIGTAPERGEVGSGNNIFFEDIDADLEAPIDAMDAYLQSDPLRGWFAAFELGVNIGYISFEDIRFTLYKEKFPLSCPVCVGPKSIVRGEYEIFDPYLSSTVEQIDFARITVNGKPVKNAEELVHCTVFEDINHDGHSTARGRVGKIRVLE